MKVTIVLAIIILALLALAGFTYLQTNNSNEIPTNGYLLRMYK